MENEWLWICNSHLGDTLFHFKNNKGSTLTARMQHKRHFCHTPLKYLRDRKRNKMWVTSCDNSQKRWSFSSSRLFSIPTCKQMVSVKRRHWTVFWKPACCIYLKVFGSSTSSCCGRFILRQMFKKYFYVYS